MDDLTSAILCSTASFTIILILFLGTSMRIIREDTRLSVYRLGRYIGDKGPGIVLLIPFIDRGVLKTLGQAEQIPSLRLVGAIGMAHTTVYYDGKVILASEEWDATSRTPIPAGERVRVVRMILEVEKE